MTSVTISAGDITIEAAFFDTPTAKAIAAALPLKGRVHVWGEEIYFEIPHSLPLEADAREEMAVGELAYWPSGPAFCIFFGPTPVSVDHTPRAYSPVNVFGKISGDVTLLKTVADGQSIQVMRSTTGPTS